MVQLIYGVKKGEAIPGEAVGLMPPTPYIAALLDYSAKLDKMDEKIGKEKAKESAGPEEAIARKVKSLSLFPNIYEAKADETPKVHFSTGPKKSNYKREEKKPEPHHDTELAKKKPLKL